MELNGGLSNFYRYDWLAKKKLRAGYFVWAMTAYGTGMINTKPMYDKLQAGYFILSRIFKNWSRISYYLVKIPGPYTFRLVLF